MKKVLFTVIALFTLSVLSFAQVKPYWSSASEMIFSLATIDDNGNESSAVLRWSPVFNYQGMGNFDFSENFGFFAGIAVRNVGYIYDDYKFLEGTDVISVKKKFVTYRAGIPLGVKIGDLNGFFVYGGYEVEYPFFYKEKTFRDEKKDKFSVWFSDRVEPFQHGFLVGFQFPYGGNLKFKYYLSEFHNKSYTESSGFKPYEGLSANVFYFSLNFNLFTPVKVYYDKEARQQYY
ncbi:MAG: hypothetical protein KDC05_16740 [Bacteroidales bacterium]|nr:hypothetical protein [Bacteroidales bacterium]